MASKKESVGKRKAQPIFTHNLKLVLLLAFSLILGLEFLVIQRTFSDFYRQSDLEIQALINDGKEQLNLAKKDALQPLGLSAALAAGSKNINFFWTPNNDSTQFYRLYHGIESGQYNESYDSQLKANSIEFDYSQMSLKTHYFALTAIGSNGVESAKSAEIAIDLGNLNKCGNGLIEPGNGEICDNNSKDCIFGSGRYRGKKMCISSGTDACKAWDSTCQAAEFCGDGITNGDEACDGQGTFTCNSGLYTGQASCDSTCNLNGCNIEPQSCGNKILEGREQCEKDAAGNFPPDQNCTWNGFAGKKNCSACLWSDCLVTPACGPNNGKDLTSLTYYDSGNCSPGVVGGFALNSGVWSWTCSGSSGTTPASCSATKRTNGVCGLANDVPISGGAPTSGLCTEGNTTGATSLNGKYIWTCNGSGAGSNSASCSAPICGNGIVTSPEQCDFGSANNSVTSGCSDNCKYGNYFHSCPALPAGYNVFNSVTGYNIKCTGTDGNGNACGAWESSPVKDLVTEYNLQGSETACRFKCNPDQAYGKCGADVGCQTSLANYMNCGACGNTCDADKNYDCLGTWPNKSCQCSGSYKDCDGNTANGCEINTASNSSNCGACNNVCPPLKQCSNGACACSSGECSGVCVDLQSDKLNCGGCGKKCTDGDFGSHGFCQEGVCACGPGYEWDEANKRCKEGACGDGVVIGSEQCEFNTNFVSSNPPLSCNSSCKIIRTKSCNSDAEAGGYSNLNSVDFLCSSYTQICNVSATQDGQTYCSVWGQQSFPIFNPNPYHVCSIYSNTCEYTCKTGRGNCNSQNLDTCEVDLNTDENHCGSCSGSGSTCTGSYQCINGSCQKCGDGVKNGNEECDGANPSGLYCDNALCKVYKQVGCADTDYQNYWNSNGYSNWVTMNFCGSSGAVFNVYCQNGKYNASNNCPSDSWQYANTTPPVHDESSCPNNTCYYGCNAGYKDCDENSANGCEINTNSNNSHCGDCNVVCGGSYNCNNGTCERCGDGVVNGDEQCDGANFGGFSCGADCKLHKNVVCGSMEYKNFWQAQGYANFPRINFCPSPTFVVTCAIFNGGTCTSWDLSTTKPPKYNATKCEASECSYSCKNNYYNLNNIDEDTCESATPK